MSSATSSYAQIEKRTKFLLTTASTRGFVVDGLYSVIASDELGGTATFDLSGATSLIESEIDPLASGVLLKDLGRQITIVSAANNLVRSVYRQVQQVNGADSEGVGGAADPAPTVSTDAIYGCFYVKVFDSAGSGITVVRTG